MASKGIHWVFFSHPKGHELKLDINAASKADAEFIAVKEAERMSPYFKHRRTETCR